VIDAIDLVLVKPVEDNAIQLVRRLPIAAKRFLDDYSRPGMYIVRLGMRSEPARRQVLDGRFENARRNGKVEETVPVALRERPLDLVEAAADGLVHFVARQVAVEIGRASCRERV
jgi:hypothetical protein